MRQALLPESDLAESPAEGLATPATLGFARPADARPGFGSLSSSYGTSGLGSQELKDTRIADHSLWSSQLDKIQRFLLQGDRRAAYHYAADEKLWAHAMVIASSIDKEAWKEVVSEFVRSELSGAVTGSSTNIRDMASKSTGGREPLKVAYNLFAGQGPTSGMPQFSAYNVTRERLTHRFSSCITSTKTSIGDDSKLAYYILTFWFSVCPAFSTRDCNAYEREFPATCASRTSPYRGPRKMGSDDSDDLQ